MTPLVKDFDEMRKGIETDKKGSELLKNFRKRLKQTEARSDKLGEYFDRSLNSGEPDCLAKELGLL